MSAETQSQAEPGYLIGVYWLGKPNLVNEPPGYCSIRPRAINRALVAIRWQISAGSRSLSQYHQDLRKQRTSQRQYVCSPSAREDALQQVVCNIRVPGGTLVLDGMKESFKLFWLEESVSRILPTSSAMAWVRQVWQHDNVNGSQQR